MDKEAVLRWLQDAQAATMDLDEFDEGFFDPDKSNHSSPQDSSMLLHAQHLSTKQTPYLTGTRQFSPSLMPLPASQVPGVATAATRRAAFKLTKSNTLCGDHPHDKSNGTHMKQPYLTRKAPSFDVPSFDVPEHDGNLNQGLKSPLRSSPFPSSNPDFVLPTILLTQNAPERKPLLQQSSAAFLSKLMTKMPEQYQLKQSTKCRCMNLPKCVKSAPCSPGLERRAIECHQCNKSSVPVCTSCSERDLSQIGRDIVEPITASVLTVTERGVHDDESDSTGSCVANQGDLSDVASFGDMEGERVTATVSTSEETFPMGGLVQRQEGDTTDHHMAESKYWMKETGQLQSSDTLFASDEPKATPIVQCFQQATSKVLTSPPKCNQAMEATDRLADLLQKKSTEDHNGKVSYLSKRNPLRHSSSVDHTHSAHQDLASMGSNSQLNSLAFHDHHLGRMTSRGLVRSPTLDDGSGSKSSGHLLHGHSPLLGRKAMSATARDTTIQDVLVRQRSGNRVL